MQTLSDLLSGLGNTAANVITALNPRTVTPTQTATAASTTPAWLWPVVIGVAAIGGLLLLISLARK